MQLDKYKVYIHDITILLNVNGIRGVTKSMDLVKPTRKNTIASD